MSNTKKLRGPRRKKRVSRRAKRGTHVSPKGGTFNFRSGWEQKYALYLDADPNVLSYRYEPYSIPYLSNVRTGKVRRYHPDFEVAYADGTKCLVEIKPKRKLTIAKNVKKFAAARLHCDKCGMTWSVVTETELKVLGLV